MGKQKSSAFYNKKIDLAFIPYEKSPWKQLYEVILNFMPKDKNIRILDLGCGTGRLAYLLNKNGYKFYKGIDFAKILINEARRYVPNYNFEINDIFQIDTTNFDLIIISEVLEHLNEDLELLNSISKGKKIIYTVPNFDSEGHVRWFNSIEEVHRRYDNLVKPIKDKTITYNHNVKLNAFIIKGTVL